MSDLKILPSGDLVVAGDGAPMGAYQALYYHVTKKTDRIRKIFLENHSITRADLLMLHQRLRQTIAPYPIQGCGRESVTIGVSNGENLEYSSFERFDEISMLGMRPTKYIRYELDFMTILPVAPEVAQRYKIRIFIEDSSASEDDEYDEIPRLESQLLLFEFLDGVRITLSIDYVDFTVALAIRSAIEDWVNTLVRVKQSEIIDGLLKRGMQALYNVPLIAGITTLLASGAIANAPLSRLNLPEPKWSIVSALGIAGLVYVATRMLLRKTFRIALRLRSRPFILLSSGDDQRKSNHIDGRRSLWLSLGTIYLASQIALAPAGKRG